MPEQLSVWFYSRHEADLAVTDLIERHGIDPGWITLVADQGRRANAFGEGGRNRSLTLGSWRETNAMPQGFTVHIVVPEECTREEVEDALTWLSPSLN